MLQSEKNPSKQNTMNFFEFDLTKMIFLFIILSLNYLQRQNETNQQK